MGNETLLDLRPLYNILIILINANLEKTPTEISATIVSEFVTKVMGPVKKVKKKTILSRMIYGLKVKSCDN